MILGQKIGLSHIFKNDKVMPVTIIQAIPNTICDIKTKKIHGYNAVQLGWGKKDKQKKPQIKHLEKSKSNPFLLKEIRIENLPDLKIGEKIDVNQFKIGQPIKISAISKGKGFSGVIKRHGFHRGPKTHGSDHHRAPGSIGSAYPQRVLLGKKMAGRLGGEQVTIYSKIVDIISEDNLLVVFGSVPGPKKSIVSIKINE